MTTRLVLIENFPGARSMVGVECIYFTKDHIRATFSEENAWVRPKVVQLTLDLAFPDKCGKTGQNAVHVVLRVLTKGSINE